MPTSNRLYEIEKKASEFISTSQLFSEDDKVLIALSGGADSIFALHILIKLAAKLKISISAAHINHMLRGKESDDDERFCQRICDSFNVELFRTSVNVKENKTDSKKSEEEIARYVRYDYLSELSARYSFNKIVTAHNKNDNTETVLLNLLKGTGLSGLAGIPVRRENIVRPFLNFTKNEILEYLNESGIEYRTDSSNESNDYERNFIRNKLIPLLQENINPKVVEAIDRTSINLSAFLDTQKPEVVKLWNDHVFINDGSYSIKLKLFVATNHFLVGELIKKLFNEKMGIEFNSIMLEAVIGLSQNQTGKRISLSEKWCAVRERESIDFIRETNKDITSVEFVAGKSVRAGTLEIITEIIDVSEYNKSEENGCKFISADNLDDIFILRNWKSGDKIIPLGMSGHKKISDYLTDLKIPNLIRKSICVVTNNKKIVWVVGFGISDEFKIDSSTKRVCKLCLKK